jgi:structural maintenance of chromosome 4
VSVHFAEIEENQDTYKIIPDSELVISRTAHRSNKNQYYINNKISSFTEVTDLLRGKGIDLDHNRFLILQGEVESIAQMKPKAQNAYEDGLLEYLEDIIGTTKYKQPIEDLANMLNELNDTRTDVAIRARRCEKEMNVLTIRKDEAIDYLRTENEVIRLKSILFQANNYEATHACLRLQANLVSKLGPEPDV